MEREETKTNESEARKGFIPLTSHFTSFMMGALLAIYIQTACTLHDIEKGLERAVDNIKYAPQDSRFLKYDTNKDGLLDREELRNYTSNN